MSMVKQTDGSPEGDASQFQVPADFWPEFLIRHWHPQRPGVIKRPFASPLLTSDDVFRALLARTERLRNGDASLETNLILDDRDVIEPHKACSTPEQLATLAVPSDGTLDRYVRRVLAQAGAREFSIFQRNVQVLDDTIYWNVLEILRTLWTAIGVPMGGATCSFFIGNYKQTFLGVHKDKHNIMTYVVQGPKRYLLWPYEHFATSPEPQGDARHCHATLSVDWRDHERHAIVLEADTGDIVYWPHAYWHVADAAESDRICATLFMGGIPHTHGALTSPFRLYDDALTTAELHRVTVGDAGFYAFPFGRPADQAEIETALERIENNVRRLLDDGAFRQEARERMLAWMTGFGLERVPDPLDPPELHLDDRLKSDARYPIYWLDAGADLVALSAHGQILTGPSKMLPLVRYLNEGHTFTVREIVEQFSGMTGTASAEEIADNLAQLCSVRALRLVPGAPVDLSG
jgi:hypothetical protein